MCLTDSLDKNDPQIDLQEKAIHTIAAEYIKNRTAGDILIEELRGYEQHCIEQETALSEALMEIQKL